MPLSLVGLFIIMLEGLGRGGVGDGLQHGRYFSLKKKLVFHEQTIDRVGFYTQLTENVLF